MREPHYSLEIKEEALDEIIQAYQYYESQVEGLGEKFLSQLDIYFERITSNPRLFASNVPPYREAFIQIYPYLIIYEIDDTSVVVYSVFNTHRNPKDKYQK